MKEEIIYGNLIISKTENYISPVLKVMNPTDITEEEKKLFEQLKKISKYNPREIRS